MERFGEFVDYLLDSDVGAEAVGYLEGISKFN